MTRTALTTVRTLITEYPRHVTIAMLVALFLAGCGGQPARVNETPAATGSTSAAKSPTMVARKSGVVQKRGGAYYKDDGPGDEIPDNLDSIPDAVPQLEPLHRFANRPYVVLGKSYTPETGLRTLTQRGIASWYGKKFHGQNTSIGEPYDMFAMTAAHPTLAIPSYARVTNLSNGKSVVVRVTDRGPFHADRIMDLSYAAAYRLGYVDAGSTQVEVETIVPGGTGAPLIAQSRPKMPPVVVNAARQPADDRDELGELAARLASNETPPPPAPVSAPSLGKGTYLQLGAFSSADNAENLRTHLLRELDWLNDNIAVSAGGGMHRVHLGPYASRADAEKVAEKIRVALGFKPTFVTR